MVTLPRALEVLARIGRPFRTLRYGENPQQAPAEHYVIPEFDHPLAVQRFKILGETDPGWVNTVDIHRLLEIAVRIAAGWYQNHRRVPFMCIIVKHGNVCGAAVGWDSRETMRNAIMGEPVDMLGGVVLTNFHLKADDISFLKTEGMSGGRSRILGGIVAPSITDDAVTLVKRKDEKSFVMVNPELNLLTGKHLLEWGPVFRQVLGGLLIQPQNTYVLDWADERLTSHGERTAAQKDDLLLAQAVAWSSNSNTTTIVRHNMVLGNAVGQQGRAKSCQLAVDRAREACGLDATKGAVAATDSFFPFTDGPRILRQAGISTIFATSGGKNDHEVLIFCVHHGISITTIPDKIGRGFAGH